MNKQTKHQIESQRFVKLKEVQANTQSKRFCITFNFIQTHQNPPTSQRQIQNIQFATPSNKLQLMDVTQYNYRDFNGIPRASFGSYMDLGAFEYHP